MKYKVGQYVEFQPDSGPSRNVRIREVLERDCYMIKMDGHSVMIHKNNILGLNLQLKLPLK